MRVQVRKKWFSKYQQKTNTRYSSRKMETKMKKVEQQEPQTVETAAAPIWLAPPFKSFYVGISTIAKHPSTSPLGLFLPRTSKYTDKVLLIHICGDIRVRVLVCGGKRRVAQVIIWFMAAILYRSFTRKKGGRCVGGCRRRHIGDQPMFIVFSLTSTAS